MSEKKQIGKLGENLASEYLKEKGYRILNKNYRCNYGEIDIICIKDLTLVFVEVKTRKNYLISYASQSINFKKKRNIFLTMQVYLKTYEIRYSSIRIDVIEIYLQKREINHIKNIEV